MPINSVPVAQSAFTRMMLITIEPKMDRETGAQFRTKDGAQGKWTVQVVASMPSRWDAARSDSEVLLITLTSDHDQVGSVAEGDPVVFDGLTVGVVAPTAGEGDRIRGGKLFWQATGVRARVPAGGK